MVLCLDLVVGFLDLARFVHEEGHTVDAVEGSPHEFLLPPDPERLG